MKKFLLISGFLISSFCLSQYHNSITTPPWTIVKINDVESPLTSMESITQFSNDFLSHAFVHIFEGPIDFPSWDNIFVKTGAMHKVFIADIYNEELDQFQGLIDSFYFDAPVGTEYSYEVTYSGQYDIHLKVTKMYSYDEAHYIAHILSDENAVKKKFQVAFNRANGNLRIISPEKITEVRIFDMSGKEVRKNISANGKNQTEVSTVGLPKGVYFATVNLKYSSKFIVQ